MHMAGAALHAVGSGTKTLLFQGRKGDNLKTQLIEISKKTALEENMPENDMNATFNERGERVVVWMLQPV